MFNPKQVAKEILRFAPAISVMMILPIVIFHSLIPVSENRFDPIIGDMVDCDRPLAIMVVSGLLATVNILIVIISANTRIIQFRFHKFVQVICLILLLVSCWRLIDGGKTYYTYRQFGNCID
jgi:hypothetical protein